MVFKFDEECSAAFQTLKNKLTTALVMIAPDWSKDFELMCDANVVTKKRDAATLIVRQWGKENVGERWCEK